MSVNASESLTRLFTWRGQTLLPRVFISIEPRLMAIEGKIRLFAYFLFTPRHRHCQFIVSNHAEGKRRRRRICQWWFNSLLYIYIYIMVFIILWRIRIIYQSFTIWVSIFFFLRQIIVKYFKRSKLIFQKIIAKDVINNIINVADSQRKKKERKRSYWNETIQTIVKDEDKRQTQFKKKKEKKMNRNTHKSR